MMKNAFYFNSKALFVLKILVKKDKVSFKFYDVSLKFGQFIECNNEKHFS